MMRKTDEMGAARKKLEDYSYLLTHNIGKGYSSQVFKGRNDLTEQPVAIKVIDMKMIKGEVHKNLLASEIEVLKALKNSENIIEVYDIYNTKNNTYIITELCDGGDLSKLIASKKSLSEAEAIPLMNQIINGYNQVYAKGIIHRDLKPANIFLRGGQIKIADFGFAMKNSDSKKYSSYNVGSPVYMPPQALNDNKYSFKSDLWALGVIYYEMLTGKTPWRAKTQKELAKQLISIPIKKLLPPSISHSSESFLIRTLTTDIAERMNPEELLRFTLTNDKSSFSKQLYSTENSIFDGKNNNIRTKNEISVRHETSLNKNSINTPTNLKRLTFLQAQDSKAHNFSLPKTAATISNNKTQQYISPSTQTINNVQALTQKQINVHQSVKDGQVGAGISGPSFDKKVLSKQLLSQIHFCRFLYKLIVRMRQKLGDGVNEQMKTLKDYMCGIVFEKLQQIDDLKCLPSKIASEYKLTNDYSKISQIVQQYQTKYTKDLTELHAVSKPLPAFKEHLTTSILFLYESILQDQNLVSTKEEVIVLDYLVTLRQLVSLLQNGDIEGFHNKSKIEAIVEGAPSKNITQEHMNAIRSKLRAIKII